MAVDAHALFIAISYSILLFLFLQGVNQLHFPKKKLPTYSKITERQLSDNLIAETLLDVVDLAGSVECCYLDEILLYEWVVDFTQPQLLRVECCNLHGGHGGLERKKKQTHS